jgi:Type II restriction endonuclease EcoO109I
MRPINLRLVKAFIEERIGPDFHQKKLVKLKKLTLDTILKRKNPYLFKAKGAVTANDLIEAVLDATVSSGEETIFGNFLEKIAIFVCKEVYGGKKSATKGLDLEFQKDGRYYIVSIKSGPNWGNSSQIEKMQSAFSKAKKTLRTSGGIGTAEIVAIEGCCYGKDNSPEKGDYQKLCGQRFWKLLSARDELYRELIEPLGASATERNAVLVELRAQKLNLYTKEFLSKFCDKGLINWDKLIRYNSGA